uniref:Ig-like domain-containing protein n=1 Tax=Acanthochromis polyacanthus TaxID=80966 RepID=A0A3Q1GBM0_9TELE
WGCMDLINDMLNTLINALINTLINNSVFLSSDGFMQYRIDHCLFNSTDLKDIEYIKSNYYNKVEYVRFTSSLGKFVGFNAYGIYNAERWNNDPTELSRWRAQKETYCQHNIGLTVLCVPVQPTVRLQSVPTPSGHHPSMLVCSVYDFYPKNIKVSWFRDRKEVSSDVTSTEEMENGDWYYQIHSHLEYTPRNKIAIGASGLVLGLVLSLAGFIYYKRKARGQTSLHQLIPVYTCK